jgi:hypothetical protein
MCTLVGASMVDTVRPPVLKVLSLEQEVAWIARYFFAHWKAKEKSCYEFATIEEH